MTGPSGYTCSGVGLNEPPEERIIVSFGQVTGKAFFVTRILQPQKSTALVDTVNSALIAKYGKPTDAYPIPDMKSWAYNGDDRVDRTAQL